MGETRGEPLHPDQQRAFTEFVTTRSDSLIRLAYLLTNDQHAAEDLLQTALAKTAGHWRRIRDNPEAYVRQVMYHEQVGRWRSPRWSRERLVLSPPDRATDDRTHEVETHITLAQALRALPARKRAVLVLRYYEDLSESEVAKIMGCSVGTVRSQTHQAIARLRAVIGKTVTLEA